MSSATPYITEHSPTFSLHASTVKPTKKIEKWDLLYKSMCTLSKLKTHREIIDKLPSILESLIEFDRFSIILLDPTFRQQLGIRRDKTYSEGGLNVGRVFYNGEWLSMLSVDRFPCSKPQFHSASQLVVGRKR